MDIGNINIINNSMNVNLQWSSNSLRVSQGQTN